MILSKKIFLASSILFAVSLLLLGVYKVSFTRPSSSTPENPSEKSGEKNPAKKTSGIALLTEDEVLSPVFSEEENAIRYYSRKDGRAYQINSDGSGKKILSDKELIGLSGIFWSPDRTKVISKFVSGSGQPRFFVYDYAKNQGSPFKNNVDAVFWDNNGNSVIYKYYDQKTKKRTLNVADPETPEKWSQLIDLEYPKASVAPVPRTGLISFWPKPESFRETKLETLPLTGGERKLIFQGKFGADFLWNGNGTRTLVSHSDVRGGSKMQLGVINDRGGEYKNLNFPTFVSKCAWSKDNQNVFCALPGTLPGKSVLPDEYDAGKIFTADTFWKINTANGEKTRLVELEDLEKINATIDASGLFLNPDESLLFFLNRKDNRLYKISL